ncbi:MAG: 16S rRNA (cytosine(1402)-N(4))-methyltransferase RsmH [Vicinamibacterales bacterium]
MVTPPNLHRPIMVEEVLRCLHPSPGDVAVDCTLGGGGHAQAILERVRPGGRLIGIDVDSIELPRTVERLRAAGFGPEAFAAHHANFTHLPAVLASEGVPGADVILVDLGVSAMQHDNPARGFSFRGVGPLDMRMDPARGETAAQLIARLSKDELASLLTANADEPHAGLIAGILKSALPDTTHALTRLVRLGLNEALPDLPNAAVKMSVRRTLQALRIAVNDEFAALDTLLGALPQCLAPGGRVAVLTFHSGEDRRVKKAFLAGRRAGVYAAIAGEVIRSTKAETFANRRASSAKLRWAVRAA